MPIRIHPWNWSQLTLSSGIELPDLTNSLVKTRATAIADRRASTLRTLYSARTTASRRFSHGWHVTGFFISSYLPGAREAPYGGCCVGKVVAAGPHERAGRTSGSGYR